MNIDSKINFLDYIDDVQEFEDFERCLISKEKLDDNMVKLNCGHKFNYECLFLDIFNQKKKLNAGKITYFCCPYCRVENKSLLPEYKGNKKFIKISNVNIVDDRYKLATNSYNKQSYIIIKNDIQCDYYKKNNNRCEKTNTKFCQLDGKYYCSCHSNVIYAKMFGSSNLLPEFNNNFVTKLTTCCAILKSGKNKGNLCGCKVKHNKEFCKRHEKIEE